MRRHLSVGLNLFQRVMPDFPTPQAVFIRFVDIDRFPAQFLRRVLATNLAKQEVGEPQIFSRIETSSCKRLWLAA